MHLTMLKAKIHRCTITHADVDYEGSVTISQELMEAAGIVEHEQVHIWNVSNGARVVTYAMQAPRDSGIVCINGAAATLMRRGQMVIIAAFVAMSEAEVAAWKPKVVFVDANNRIRAKASRELPGPELASAHAEGAAAK